MFFLWAGQYTSHVQFPSDLFKRALNENYKADELPQIKVLPETKLPSDYLLVAGFHIS